MPALIGALVVGAALGGTGDGVMAAAGAFSVGFGAFQPTRRSRATMLLAMTSICLSSWIGALAGRFAITTVLLGTLAGFVYGLVSARGPTAGWIALQGLVWAMISTAFPATGRAALVRGAMALVGGGLQLVTTSLIFAVAPRSAPRPRGGDRARAWRDALPAACRSAAVMATASALYRFIHIPNGYWIPMTAGLVSRPVVSETVKRGVARVLGTILGAAVATIAAAAVRPTKVLLVSLVALFAFSSYLFVRANYAVFVACLTAYVVFVLALAGLPARVVVGHRALCTSIGGTLAIVLHAALRTHRPRPVQAAPDSRRSEPASRRGLVG